MELGEPLGSVMFYGQGAGAGATASAVDGDLMQIICSGRNCAEPTMIKTADGVCDFSSFVCKNYVSVKGGCENCVKGAFGEVSFIDGGDEIAFITAEMSEKDTDAAVAALTAKGISVNSRIRLL